MESITLSPWMAQRGALLPGSPLEAFVTCVILTNFIRNLPDMQDSHGWLFP